MPEVEFSLTALFRELGGAWLAEALFFPEFARLGDDADLLLEQLLEHARRVVTHSEPLEIHRRALDVTPQAGTFAVELPPPATLAWRDPLTLNLPVVRWPHGAKDSGPSAFLAYLPTLGIEVVAATPEDLERMLPEHARAALLRSKMIVSLRQLVELARCPAVRVRRATFRAPVLSPKQHALEEDERSRQEKSVLADVATPLSGRRLDPAFEIGNLISRIAEALTGRVPRSVLLVGPSGAGKSAAFRELVRCGPEHGLGHVPFWETSGSRLVAGMTGFGMWEQRCQAVLREASKTKAILHFGNLVELLEVGKSVLHEQGIAAFFRPYLARGDLLAVAECTPEQIPILERQDPHLLGAFIRIDVEEPSPERGLTILRRSAALSSPAPLTEDALATLDRLHRRYATYSASPGRPLRFLHNLLRDRAGGTVLGAAEVLEAFARETGLPRVLLLDAVRLDLEETLRWFTARVLGQEDAVRLVVDLLATVKAGLTRPRRPIASLLFIGPTGVGKTETAKALAEFLFGSPERMTRLDMSEYADPLAVQRLVGGGHGTEGVLTARVREQPFSVVLLDEFEKAHPLLFDLLLQVLGEGHLTDAAGRLADFCNCVVILTSNLGAETYQQGAFGFAGDGDRRAAARGHFTDAVRAFLRPELFNRIDRIVPFDPLDAATICKIAQRQIELVRLRDGIRYRNVALDVAAEVVEHLARAGYDARYGARPLKRALERELLAPLAERMNQYSSDRALAVEVRAEGGGLRCKVRARTDDEGRQVSGSGAGGTDAALRCQALRRDAQALARCSAVEEVEGEIYLLAQREKRILHRQYVREQPLAPEELAVLARLKVLRGLTGELKSLTVALCALEDEALLGLYGQTTVDRELIASEQDAARRRRDALLMELYLMRFPGGDRATLAVYGEDPEWLFELAGAYYDVVGPGSVEEVHEVLPAREGRDPVPRDFRIIPEAPWKLVTEAVGAPKDEGPVWRLLPEKEKPEMSPPVLRHQIVEPAKFFAPRGGVLGILMSVRQRGAQARLLPEGGLHVGMFKRTSYCFVEGSALPPERYCPPPRIDRHATINGQPKRRVYREAQGDVLDVPRNERTPWVGRELAPVLRQVIEAALLRAAASITET